MENILYMVLDETSFYTDNVISNSLVSHIHFTGSVKTLNSISHKTKARITSELGCVTPWIVLPGSWTQSELKKAASQIVLAKLAGGGALCMSPQVVLLANEWDQKLQFQECLRDEFSMTYMRYMFCKASSFNQPLNKWNVSNVGYMEQMFRDASSFNQPLHAPWYVMTSKRRNA